MIIRHHHLLSRALGATRTRANITNNIVNFGCADLAAVGITGDVTVGTSVGLIGRYPGGRAIGVGRFSQITAGVVMVR